MYMTRLPTQCSKCPSTIILERFIINIAYTDALTGLYNRRYLQEYDKENLKNLFSVMIIDLDNFKYINDSYGHNAGDTALKKLGEIINELNPQKGIRYGGDEFVVILPDRNREYALQSGQQLLSRISTLNFPWGFHIAASIGTATYPDFQANSLLELLSYADRALYISKKRGKGTVTSYSNEFSTT